jgi:hypothetical protein
MFISIRFGNASETWIVQLLKAKIFSLNSSTKQGPQKEGIETFSNLILFKLGREPSS